MYRPNKQAR